MNIAQVVCVYPPYRGGIGKIAQDNTKSLENRGHRVTVFTTAVKASLRNSDANIKYLRPFLKFGNAAMLPALFFKLNKFDVVYLHYPFFGSTEIIFLLKLIFKNKIKLVIHYHMDTLDLSFFKRLFLFSNILIRNKLFSVTDLIVCASLDYIQSSQIANVYKKNPGKFVEIPFSVDSNKFFPQKKNGTEAIVITFVGGMDRAHYFKGVDLLLKAFSEIIQPNIVLRLIGNGELIANYKLQAKKLGIESKVQFFTNINNDELVKKYQESDIFVLPSINRHEAFGVVLLEAMSSGVPVIASALPGVRKVFSDGLEGLLFEPGNEIDLKEKLEYLILNNDRRKEMGINARNLVLKKYDKQVLNKKLEDALALIIKT